MAGSRFATLIRFPQIRLVPTQKISIEPVSDMLDKACSVMKGSTSRASSVMDPWKIPTGMAEKIQPFPMDAVMIIIIIRSRMA